MIVLDTNVLSETMKPQPTPSVLVWLAEQPRLLVFTTAITQAEIMYGVELLPKGQRQAALQSAVEAIFVEDFAGRVLPFDTDAALDFAKIAAAHKKQGSSMAQFDAQIAAIARSRKAALATRNVSHFKNCGLKLLNPWKERA